MAAVEPIASHALPFMQWMLISSASATLIAGAVLIVQILFSRWLTPAGRQRLWLLVIIRLILPILPASAISIANIHFEKLWTHKFPEVQGIATPPAAVERQFEVVPHRVTVAVVIEKKRSWTEVLPIAQCIGWGAIAIALLSHLIWANRKLAVSLQRSARITDPEVTTLVQNCAQLAGLKRAPMLVETDAVTTPAVFGIRRPVILLPTGLLGSLSPMQRRHVVLHELSHICHQDLLANWMLAILCIAHWFNPLLWLAFARMKADREIARDAWVLRRIQHDDRDSYAGTLIDLAQRLSFGRMTRTPIPGQPLPQLFGRATSLKRRLHMIARLSDSHRGSTLLSVSLLVLVGGAVLTRAHAQSAQTTPEKSDTVKSSGTPTTQPSIEKLTQSAKISIRTGQYLKALEQIDHILQQQPKNDYANGVRPLLVDKIGTTHPEVVVRDRLNKVLPTEHFDAVGFNDTIDFMRDILGLKIVVNWSVIEASGYDRNTPVTVDLHDIKASKSLETIFESASAGKKEKLKYVVEGDTLIITTQSDLGTDPVVRSYDINSLLGTKPADAEARRQRTASLIKTITDFIDRDSWKDNGGAIGSVKEANGMLAITQRPANQRRIMALLQSLEGSAAKKD